MVLSLWFVQQDFPPIQIPVVNTVNLAEFIALLLNQRR